jgi:prepilin-type N-terminal cleavage/methylation domain-containing protein
MAEIMFTLHNKKQQHGVTLVELMLFIAIIGILSVLAISNYLNYRNRAYCFKAEDDAQLIHSALSAYFSDPDNESIPTIDELKRFQELSLNNSSEISYSSRGSKWVVISVGDDINRCPYDKENQKYYVYFGTTGTAGWK